MSLSVVIPSLGNRPEQLLQAVTSAARQQDINPPELIVVDASGGGTVGNSCDLPRQVQVITSGEPLTAGAARALGTESAHGEWIAYCDDDDLWHPSKLAAQIHALKVARVRWSTAGAVLFQSTGQPLWAQTLPEHSALYRQLLRGNIIPGGGSSCVLHRSLISEAGGWDTRLTNAEDWDLWLRCAQVEDLAYVHSPLVGYRVHSSNKSRNLEGVLDSHRRILAKHPSASTGDADLNWMYRRRVLLGDFAAARAIAPLLPHRSPSTQVLRGACFVAPMATSQGLRALARFRTPHGWLKSAPPWLQSTGE